jgi:phosphoglycerate dehydrogenase-like enzyme
LFGLENVILSPHAGAYSEEAHEEVRRRAAMSVARFLNGEQPEELINPEVLA